MKVNTYIKYLMAFAVICLSACNSDEEASTAEEDTDSGDVESADEEETAQNDETSEEESQEPLLSEADVYDDDSIQTLANKSNFLGEEYVPEDLVTVEVSTVLEGAEVNQLREEASDALTEMFADAEVEDIILYARSGYRSYDTQVELYDNYRRENGEEAAQRFSAEPGASEHQTGLAMDVTSESVDFELDEAFGETEEGTWLRENAHEYGFIIRYPEDMEDITGYMYEPWHLRYLGEEVATDVYESDITYEEYIMESGVDINEE